MDNTANFILTAQQRDIFTAAWKKSRVNGLPHTSADHVLYFMLNAAREHSHAKILKAFSPSGKTSAKLQLLLKRLANWHLNLSDFNNGASAKALKPTLVSLTSDQRALLSSDLIDLYHTLYSLA